MSTWTHAVLEIYEPDSGWPTEGTPVDWVSDKSVGWCDGRPEDLVCNIHIVRIILWKIRHKIEWIRDVVQTYRESPWDKYEQAQWDAASDENFWKLMEHINADETVVETQGDSLES